MSAQFDLHILGSPRLWDRHGAPVRFRTKKQLALLTYLHFEGRERPLSRDRLAGLLWPGASPEKGRHSLSQALLAIRARLGANALTQRERDVRLLAELASDLDALQDGHVSLPSVLEPLLGIEDCAGAEFAHWVDAARTRIRGRARDGLRAALKKARSSGDLVAVQRIATLVYGIDPLCADAVYALAERALLDGDAVMAVRLLKEQTHRAQAELGLNPNPEIAQLLRRLERGERPAFLAPASALPTTFTRREVFVGREAELSQLEAIWERTRAGGYQTCLIPGAPGIGKSSLLRRFGTSVGARAWPAFVVPCQEIGQGIPYAAVADLITSLGRDPATGGTDPVWLAEASRVSPGLRTIYPGIPEPPDAPTDSIRLRVAEAILRMTEVVSDGGPLLLALDDFHHIDAASQEVLFLITRRMERIPMLILATVRTDGIEPTPVTELRQRTLTWAATLELLPLASDQTMQMIDNLSANASDVDVHIRETIVRLAQGNPYFVEMLLSDWKRHETNSLVAAQSSGERRIASWDPPETLRSAFQRHYRGLSTDARHALQLLAVTERAMSTSEIAALLRLEVAAIERAALDVLDHGIGRVESGRIAFKNELHRAYVYYAMGEERRAYFHARVAEWLLRAAGRGDFQNLLEASHHYVSAHMPDEARDTAVAGAEVAARRGAPGEAERALRLLLRSYPQGPESSVHLVLASALVAEGKFSDAIEALHGWAPRGPLPDSSALAAQLKAEALHRGHLSDEKGILDATTLAVSAAERAGADLILIRALGLRAEAAVEAGELNDATEAGRQAQRVAEASAIQEARALAGITAGFCQLVAGKSESAAATFSTTLPLLRDLGLLVELRRAINGLGMCYTDLGRPRDAINSFAQALAVARKLGNKSAMCIAWNNLGVTYHDTGHFHSASACYHQAGTLLAPPYLSTVATHMWANRARLALEFGDFGESERCCANCLSAATESKSWPLMAAALLAKADYYIAHTEPERAWPHVQSAVSLAGDRWGLVADAGQFARLRRHLAWATTGRAPDGDESHEALPRRTLLTASEQLEVQAFEEWMQSVREGTKTRETAAWELVERGLFGVLARLLAIGVRFAAVPVQQPGESSAQLVARAFQPEQRVELPPFDEVLPPDVVRQRFV